MSDLTDAARGVLAAWYNEGVEREQVSEGFWNAMGVLESALRSGRLALVTSEPPQRRSELKNPASTHLQSAFIDEARVAMGAPSKEDAEACLGRQVTLTFNTDHPAVRGTLTEVIDHPAAGVSSPLLVLDDDKTTSYLLNAIQSIEVRP